MAYAEMKRCLEVASTAKEVVVSASDRSKLLLEFSLAASLLLLLPALGRGQEASKSTTATPPGAETPVDVQSLAQAVRELQTQVQALHAQMSQLRADEQQAQAEARDLRRELRLARTQSPSPTLVGTSYQLPAPAAISDPVPPSAPLGRNTPMLVTAAQVQANSERIGKLEEDEQLTEGKLNDQYQTKVESGSKYKLKLSGIVLMNVFSNRGVVDNLDFPGLALHRQSDDSAGTFGASFRQSQIGIQAFGPEIAGAHTSADVNFDFAGGFPDTPNGVSTGIVRLRTGTIRLDWANTSVIAGQDQLFFAPLAPTSLASLAIPPLAYAGNLWAWTPQVRIEHRIHVSEGSTVTLQGGILDSMTGESPEYSYYRSAGAGEKSGQPAYASRVAWSHSMFGQELIAGFGGYYGRQNWQFGRHVDGWTGTTDLTVPLGHFFEFTGEYYRGRAIGGLGGGIDQTILATGSLDDPSTVVEGLNSMGGWAQLKFKPVPKFEVNGAFGHDNPLGNQVARFASFPAYYDALFARNQSWFMNFVYQPRSNVLVSVEFRRLRTFGSDGGADTANHVNLSLGYLF
jgi:hypothetical protein